MARKAILEGGKRDEIIAAATTLFFTEGFENTSVRKILQKVDGEIGMFYHYFSSKEELFDVVVDRFFRQYTLDCNAMLQSIASTEELVDAFWPLYEEGMAKYSNIKSNLHWTIRSALHDRTLTAMIPSVENLLVRLNYQGSIPPDTAAQVLLGCVSAALHSKSFEAMDEAQKKAFLLHLINKILH